MKVSILKCAVVSLQRGKKSRWEGIQLLKVNEIGEADVGRNKHLGILELDKVMCDGMKRKVKEAYQERITLLVKTHLDGKNLFLALTTWAISVIRYILLSWIGQKKRQKKLTVGFKNS